VIGDGLSDLSWSEGVLLKGVGFEIEQGAVAIELVVVIEDALLHGEIRSLAGGIPSVEPVAR